MSGDYLERSYTILLLALYAELNELDRIDRVTETRHWEGCEEGHPRCASRLRIIAALRAAGEEI